MTLCSLCQVRSGRGQYLPTYMAPRQLVPNIQTGQTPKSQYTPLAMAAKRGSQRTQPVLWNQSNLAPSAKPRYLSTCVYLPRSVPLKVVSHTRQPPPTRSSNSQVPIQRGSPKHGIPCWAATYNKNNNNDKTTPTQRHQLLT